MIYNGHESHMNLNVLDFVISIRFSYFVFRHIQLISYNLLTYASSQLINIITISRLTRPLNWDDLELESITSSILFFLLDNVHFPIPSSSRRPFALLAFILTTHSKSIVDYLHSKSKLHPLLLTLKKSINKLAIFLLVFQSVKLSSQCSKSCTSGYK